MTEAELQIHVRTLCGVLSLLVDHTEDSVRGRCWLKGRPDLEIIGRRVLKRELKAHGEQPTPEQTRMGYAYKAAGVDWDVWRPDDWASRRIHRELAAISPAPDALELIKEMP